MSRIFSSYTAAGCRACACFRLLIRSAASWRLRTRMLYVARAAAWERWSRVNCSSASSMDTAPTGQSYSSSSAVCSGHPKNAWTGTVSQRALGACLASGRASGLQTARMLSTINVHTVSIRWHWVRCLFPSPLLALLLFYYLGKSTVKKSKPTCLYQKQKTTSYPTANR